MRLDMDVTVADGYKSPSQITRRITEEWGARNLYCPACESPRLHSAPANTRAIDYLCPECDSTFQLKSGSRWSQRVVDGAYSALIEAIQGDRVPNLLVLHYSSHWRVNNLLIVPSFFFTPSLIEERKPLGRDARRAGWVGCNILVGKVPPEGRLVMVMEGVKIDPADVRRLYKRVRPLSDLGVERRGWALDLLQELRGFGRQYFTLRDAYALAPILASRYPNNRHIQAKIRQQLQVLRDSGIIQFLGHGSYAFNQD